MTCVTTVPTFRLLDDLVGWDEDVVADLVGFTGAAGVRLAHTGTTPDGPTRAELLPWFPDPRLAPGCRPCAWYLISGDRLLRRDTSSGGRPLPRDASAGGWQPVWPEHCDPRVLRAPAAVAARGHRLAVADSGRVLVWRNEGDRLIAVIPDPGVAIALAADDQVLVADGDVLRRYGPDGCLQETISPGVEGTIIGIRTGPGALIWLLTEDQGRCRIYRGRRRFRPADLAELAAALPPSSLVSADDTGFCLLEPGPDGDMTTCWTWAGEPRPEPPPATGRYAAEGTFTTTLIDSGISRCRWHRVRIDVTLPADTAVSVSIVVSEDGRFADTDWQTAPPGVTDFLVDQPPGRYLTVRVRLSGDTSATPVLHRIRLDFPRATSADLLPAAFRQDPAADDFTERFLSLFDASLGEIDRVIERYTALLDPAGVPDQALPWLAGLLGLSFEAGWDSDLRRALIAAAPELYRRRGTPWALAEAIRLVFGVTPVIDELADDRHWAQVGAGARGLGAVRLFSRSSSRFRLDGSALGAAPLRSFGDPETDPLTEHAHRFRVLLPNGTAELGAVRRLVDQQAPAHTRGSVRLGETGFVVGSRSTVGVDTAFVPLPPPVLGGAHPLRLNHDGVLRPGPRGARHGLRIGEVSAVGIHTQVS
ncbi:phage tail protein [Paractinoplanes atraurantiacus]|uniref:Phage tail protein domain-containing protein n=1 Tax=Paractinoplanes atraurantiacus TaxID=1036182 RepID=A0A285HQ72_9ACTN|nr:phage tail protein [Actinoplanes atraurantiacus]SNY37855.1 phage tail protein domain-containing protein [Actinoplanes atraurantiacus]